ncbi:hypothetical protein ACFLXC_05710 [Chloroflexota bacterium]
MFNNEFAVLVLVGILFILIGVILVIWGKTEERKYYESLSTRHDVREYINHWPPRPSLRAWQVGGWIGLAVGIVLLIVGLVYALK